MKAGAIILAAGASTRLGEPKQLVRVGGETLLERALHVGLSAGLDPVVVVLGANAEEVLAACDWKTAQVAVNDEWDQGMASSLRKGVAQLAVHQVDAAVVMTCDMPFVAAGHLHALLRLSLETERDVASAYAGRKGVPAVFLRSSFPGLGRLSGDAGARSLLVDAPAVELKDADDVDTPQDLLDAQRAAARIKS